MARDIQVTVDCTDPHALGWEVGPNDEPFIRRTVEAGHALSDDTTTHQGGLVWKAGQALRRPDGVGPRRLFPLVPEAKVAKNRVHLDVWVPAGECEAEVARLHDGRQGQRTWVALADPHGNEFCVSD